MRFSLLPKEQTFFQLFQEQARLGAEAGKVLVALIEHFDQREPHVKRLEDLEHEGDALLHQIVLRLARSFITPIDREDIHSLASTLDDVLDYIHGSATRLTTYAIQTPTPVSLELAKVIREGTELLRQAVDRMTRLEDLSELRAAIKKTEKQADRIHREAVGDLFAHEKDAIEILKWKEIYLCLETVTDRCEDIMDILEGLVIKYA